MNKLAVELDTVDDDHILGTEPASGGSSNTSIFDSIGTIDPPDPIKNLIQDDPTGAGGISLFLSNVVSLIYNIAAVVVLLMLVWGALEWMLSGGDKEKVASAQRRITHALIGLVLLAIVFALLQVFGIFTGFDFFAT